MTTELTAHQQIVVRAAAIGHAAVAVYFTGMGAEYPPVLFNLPKQGQIDIINTTEYYIKNPKMSAKDVHEVWLSQMRADGWSFGPEESSLAKTHPGMLPYNEMPESNRIIDDIFRSTVLGYYNMTQWVQPAT